MALPQFQRPTAFAEYVNAASLDAALRAMADGHATPVAGGTDLWVQKDLAGKAFGPRLVNIRRIDSLRGIAEAQGRIRLGALVTITEILESATLRRAAPVLPAAADRFASAQIRNVASVGGNVCNASPAADLVVPLLALDAEAEFAAWRNGAVATRRVALTELFLGPGRTVRRPDELLTAVSFAVPGPGFVGGFCKSGPRPALEIARVALCLVATRRGAGLAEPRIAMGAVGPTPLRCRSAEATLAGGPLDEARIAATLAAADRDIKPIDDVRGSAWYRRRLARAFLEQELRRVAQG
jgi:carbon-monoxide dehydrogenase medium subunit